MKKLALLFILLFIIISAVFLFLNPPGNEFEQEDLYDKIVQRQVLKVGINPDTKPFGFYDSNKDIIGYDADLARNIAQYILKDRNKVKFIPVTLENRLIKASTGEVDIVISAVTITPQRQEIVSFSIPYDSAGQAVLVKTGSKVSSLADIAGEPIGVVFGTTAEKNIKNILPTANVVGFRTYNAAYKALKAGKIIALTSDDTILKRYAIDDSEVRLLNRRYSYEPYGIAFKKGVTTAKLKENLDYAIKDMQTRNTFPRLRNKWNL